MNHTNRASALLRGLASLQAAITMFALIAMSSPLMVYAQAEGEPAPVEEVKIDDGVPNPSDQTPPPVCADDEHLEGDACVPNEPKDPVVLPMCADGEVYDETTEACVPEEQPVVKKSTGSFDGGSGDGAPWYEELWPTDGSFPDVSEFPSFSDEDFEEGSSGELETAGLFSINRPDLTIEKTVVGGASSTDEFSVTVYSLTFHGLDAKEYTFEDGVINLPNVPTGFYSIVENDAEGYEASYEDCYAFVIPFLGSDHTCSITNTYEEPTEPVIPACDLGDDTTFDPFSLGTVNGQGGWSSGGSFDDEIVDNTYGFIDFGCKSLRLSNAVTSGSFGDQTFSYSIPNEAGETNALNDGKSGGTRQNHFEAEFDIASTMQNEQSGLSVSVSPDRGDGARMSYLRFEDREDGIHVFFDDVITTSNPADWSDVDIATLDRATSHTIKFVMDFIDGPSNDVVKIYIDGVLIVTGTSWENYYLYDDESNPSLTSNSRTVDSLLFRVGGTAAPDTSDEGFLFDNITIESSTVEAPNLCVPGTKWVDELVENNQGKRKDGSDVLPERSVEASVLGANDSAFFSLGVGGSVVVSFETYITNEDGDDLVVYETTNGFFPLETARVEVSQDGDDWHVLSEEAGNTAGGVTSLDVDETGLSWFQFVRLTDTSDAGIHQNNHDGFDLNAVKGISGVCEAPQEAPEYATVTMCKVKKDENFTPLSGWTLMLKGASVQSDLMIPVNAMSGVDSSDLEEGTSYIAVASGVWRNAGQGQNFVDAEFTTLDAWNTIVDGFTGYSTNILELQIGEEFDPENDWGPYSSTHEYAQQFSIESDGPMNFRIFDGNGMTPDAGWYGDNGESTLSVDIFKGFAGVTDGDGCVVFEDVPFGIYTIAEVNKDGWSYETTWEWDEIDEENDEILDTEYLTVPVDESVEKFTVMNSQEVGDDTDGPTAPVIIFPTSEQVFAATPILNDWTDATDPSGVDFYEIAYAYDDEHTFGGSTCPELTELEGKVVSGCRDTSATERNHVPALSEQGGVTIWVRAYDTLGNPGAWSNSVHYYYDVDGGEEGGGTITIIKNAVGGEGTFVFDISGDLDDEVSISTGDESESALLTVEEGTYAITEQEQEGWTLQDVFCSYGGEEGGYVPENNIVIEDDDNVVCTFTNSKDGEETTTFGTTTISENTSGGENLLGWMFNRDPQNQASFEFNDDESSIGDGSLFVAPITNAVVGNSDKFIGELFLFEEVADVMGISYDYMIASGGDEVDEKQFYMNIYANFGVSDDDKFYDCRYDIVPNDGVVGDFATLSFNPQTGVVTGGTVVKVDKRNTSPFNCPTIPVDMNLSSPDSTIRAVTISIGDTSASDTGISGYLDNVVTVIKTGSNIHAETYDFEPEEESLTPSSTNNGGNNGSTGNRVRSVNSGGIVLGATTECSALLTSFLGGNYPNPIDEVIKLQNFLNGEVGTALPLTGFFGPMTEAAVRAFQTKYWEDVLQPWFSFPEYNVQGADDSTGVVYKTTKWKINDLYCPGSEALPSLP